MFVEGQTDTVSSVGKGDVVTNKLSRRRCCPCWLRRGGAGAAVNPASRRRFCWDLCSFNCLQPKPPHPTPQSVALLLCSHARGCVQVLWKCCSLASTVTGRGVLKCNRASRHSKLSIVLTHCQRLRSLPPHSPSDLQVNTPLGTLTRSPGHPDDRLSSRELAYY